MAKLPVIPVPVYKVQLKTIKDPVDIRPFTVKEEKILLEAAHGITSEALTPKQKKRMMEAMAQICNNCTFGNVDVYKLPIFDLNMLFTKLKQYSSGNGQKISVPCSNEECKRETVLELDYDRFVYVDTEGHSNTIELIESVSIIMNYPSFKMAAQYEGKERDPNTIYEMTVACIDMVVVGDEATPASHFSSNDLSEFLDSLTTENRTKLTSFFDTMPTVMYEINYKCPYCGTDNTFRVDNVEDFFVSPSATTPTLAA
jgi:hypothetical protein